MDYKIPRGADDTPVFPDGDLSSEHPEVVRKVLEGYITYLWSKLQLYIIFYCISYRSKIIVVPPRR